MTIDRQGYSHRALRALLHKTGLLDFATFLRDDGWFDLDPRRLATRIRSPARREANGLPIPPAFFRYLACGSADVDRFLETGRNQVEKLIVPLLLKNQLSIDQFSRVLDFGCGCGRIMRHWSSIQGVEFWGTDRNPKLMKWCRRNLPFACFRVNAIEPPLPFDSKCFDFVYARSVLTHWTEGLQSRWLNEFRRVIPKGGFLLVTTSGDQFKAQLSPAERTRYEAGKMVVRNPDGVGHNRCASFHPPGCVANALGACGFEIRDSLRGGQVVDAVQDTYLAVRG